MVRNVFKIRSLRRTCYCQANRRMLEKRWSTVKSYLCGDEWNSIVAEKDSDSASISVSVSGIQQQQEFISSGSIWGSKTGTSILSDDDDDDLELCSNYGGEEEEEEDEDGGDSIKSSEATVTQPMNIVLLVCGEGTNKKRVRTEKPNSTLRLFQKEDAAIIIQSAFREYLARRKRSIDDGNGNGAQEGVQFGVPSPPESLKVQTGDSTDTSSCHVERHKIVCKPTQKRVKAQEEWDDSTVSSSISRKRLQNKIEAATRRERALAYAFAQQLRMCSKKKRTKCNSLDENSSLSWLERWMATRESENRFMDETKMVNSIEGKESCGSNELSLQIHGFSLKANDKPRTVSNISRRKTVPTAHPAKAGKKSFDAEKEKHRKDNIKQPESKKNVKFQDSFSVIT